MSNRSLIEFNHDFAHDLFDSDGAFLRTLYRYLCSADRETTAALEVYGVRVVGMRHHSGNYITVGVPDGFPVQHLKERAAS